MNVTVLTAALFGVKARQVKVEARVRATGLPGFHMVGLADTAVRESRIRVLSALDEAGYQLSDRNITVNLAPASIPKSGSALDLAIAVALLGAADVVPPDSLQGCLLLGELGLRGTLRPVRGVLPAALAAREQGLAHMIVPRDNAREASWVSGLTVRAAPDFASVIAHLTEMESLPTVQRPADPPLPAADPDMRCIRGQQAAKRALEVAAAGAHNILMVGPPGSGKTMLARALAAILPPMTEAEALETASVHSAAGLLREGGTIRGVRPFRAPHHSVSHAGLVGGGSIPRPGEVSLAHNGVLFLDELPEFGTYALDLLREPVEEGRVRVVRSAGSFTFPARFMLVGAMNPCRCGHHGDPRRRCVCRLQDRRRYQRRISGPLMDRFDMRIDVPSLGYAELTGAEQGEPSESIRKRVIRAREVGVQRWSREGLADVPNSRIDGPRLERLFSRDADTRHLLCSVVEQLGISARGYVRLLRVARTIADMDGAEEMEHAHVAEAVQYCRGLWEQEESILPVMKAQAHREVTDVQEEASIG